MEGNFGKIEKGRELFDTEKTKDRIEKLVKQYNLPMENWRLAVSSLEIGSFSETDFKKFFSKETKEKLGKIKEIYGLEQFDSFGELKNWVFVDREKYKKISSPEFIKQVETLADSIGSDKKEFIGYFGKINFSNIDNSLLKNIFEKKLVFSQDAKEAKLKPGLIFGTISGPSLWGRERESAGVINITDYITFGRGLAFPYKGGAYVAAGRIGREEADFRDNFFGRVSTGYLTGDESEVGFYEAKKRLDYTKEHLPDLLNKRLDSVFETLEEWRKEGEKIEQEYVQLRHEDGHIRSEIGAYVRFDKDLAIEKSFRGKLPFSEKEYKNLYDYLDRGFKAPSPLSNFIGKGIETPYDFMIKNREEYLKEKRNLEYLTLHQKELASEEIKSLERKSRNILNSFEIMESIYDSPRGVYFVAPPLHSRRRGGVPPDWDPRSFAPRDNVFYRVEKGGKENFVNVKEYHLKVVDDDLKVRLSSFSEKPDPKKLGERGLSVEIERNGETRFLNQKETENFLKELKEYTLITLYFKNSPSLKVEKENK